MQAKKNRVGPFWPSRSCEHTMLKRLIAATMADVLSTFSFRPLMLLASLACAVRAVASAWFVCAIWLA